MAGEGIWWVFIMNFNLNEDQLAYVELAQQFSINELPPHAASWNAETIFPISTLKSVGN